VFNLVFERLEIEYLVKDEKNVRDQQGVGVYYKKKDKVGTRQSGQR